MTDQTHAAREARLKETIMPCPFCGLAMDEVTDEDGHYWVHPGRQGFERADCWLGDARIDDTDEDRHAWNIRATTDAALRSLAGAYRSLEQERFTERARLLFAIEGLDLKIQASDTRAEEMAGLLREAAEVIERLWIFEHKSDESRLRLFTIRLRTAADHAAKDPTHG